MQLEAMRYAKKTIFILFAIILALLLGGLYLIFFKSPYELPKEKIIFERLKPPSSSTLYDESGTGLFYFNKKEPVSFYKPLSRIDHKLQNWVVMLEDAKFFAHKGFDVAEINNSFWKNLQAGKIKRGGSGITQQLAKNLFLDQQRSYARKLYEVPWTIKLETSLSKRQILELYLNSIEWGPGIAGAEAAARYFFGKASESLTNGEAMYLALIIPSPNRFNLIKNPGAINGLNKKKSWFVSRLVNENKIAPHERSSYLNSDFGIKSLDDPERMFPAPVSSSFTAPMWASYLKSYAKGSNPAVSINKQIQLMGNQETSWVLDSGDSNNEIVASSKWCATRDQKSPAGYWELEDKKIPSPSLIEFVQLRGYDMNPCETLDIQGAFKK